MARMYPNTLNPDTDSSAERMLFPKFKTELPDSYHVFHGVAWQSLHSRGGARDGEADFVIIHPEQGILVVEAKGGQIRYDGRSGQWLQNHHSMKDPFEQAKSSRYHLKRTLQENHYWEKRDIVYAHAVAFPDVVVREDSLTLQSPKVLILDKRDFEENVHNWVKKVFAHYRGEGHRDSFDQSGVDYLINLLAPIRELQSLMGVDIRAEAAEFVRLTTAQYKILDFLAWQSRAAIAGCAGSGKTMLAAEKARRLAVQGWRVLLTCFNVNLANFLREDYLAERPGSLEIGNFHKVATDLVRRSGQRVKHHFPSDGARQDYFSNELPEQLVTALDQLGPQYDAIVVDEAQDFLENWWLPLQMLLEEPDEGTFYLFYDDNQNIYGGIKQVKNLAQAFPLVENCRNTKKIHQMVRNFYQSDHSITALGPDGREVSVISYADVSGLAKALRITLHQLVNEEEIDPTDIVILTPCSIEASAMSRLGPLGRFHLTTNWNVDYNEIYYATIHSFKGLESPVVILAELDNRKTLMTDELVYVGCSRARHHLIILCHESSAARLGH
jgi:hypothetical protein